jgi:hypothetical protein
MKAEDSEDGKRNAEGKRRSHVDDSANQNCFDGD